MTIQSRGEAMKKITLFLFFLCVNLIPAQDKSELIQYYQQLKSQGFSDQQIKQIDNQNGYDIDELLPTNTTSLKVAEKPSKNITSNFSSKSINENIESKKSGLQVFGNQYFDGVEYNFSPQINIATPSDYQLGPGDNLIISLWGASEVSYQQNINRQGNITIDGVGPIYLNGYSIAGAKARVKKVLSKIAA